MTAAPQLAPAPTVDRLDHLTAHDFRNIAVADLSFPPAGVVIVGDNGHGKTNLLEAIAYFGALRSMRNARDRDLVRHGAPAFALRAAVSARGARHITIGVERATARKRITVDGVTLARQTDALGTLPSVAWSPADVALVAGGPGERRRYLDVMLALSSRAYLGALRDYRAALDQRNAAIRSAQRTGRGPGAVAPWEPALATRGAALVIARRAWIGGNADAFTYLCRALGEAGAAKMQYTGDAARADDPAAALAEQLERDRQRDLQRGMTSVGPHRDDVAITIDGHDARTFGSAGQQRTAAIALRLLEARTFRAHGGAHPMLLLDDPFAELDRNRTIGALSLLVAEEPGQVVLAVPREDDIPRDFAHLTRWRMHGGEIQL